MTSEIPVFCDFGCPFAAFPPAETAGICRTMAAVQCMKLHELVNTNAPCEWRRRQPAASGGKAARSAQPRRGSGLP